jgi:hypothetical protein
MTKSVSEAILIYLLENTDSRDKVNSRNVLQALLFLSLLALVDRTLQAQERAIAVFPVVDSGAGEGSYKESMRSLLVNAIEDSPVGSFRAVQADAAVYDAMLPPAPQLTNGAPYSMVTELLFDAPSGENQLYLFLYDNTTQSLIASEQLVYQGMEDLQESLSFLVFFMQERLLAVSDAAPAEAPDVAPDEESRRWWSLALAYSPYYLIAPEQYLYSFAFLPFGASLEFDWLPFQRDWGSLGIGIYGNYNYARANEGNTYGYTAHMVKMNLRFFYELPFPQNRAAMRFGGGFGAHYISDVDIRLAAGSPAVQAAAAWNLLALGYVEMNTYMSDWFYTKLGLAGEYIFPLYNYASLAFDIGFGFKF